MNIMNIPDVYEFTPHIIEFDIEYSDNVLKCNMYIDNNKYIEKHIKHENGWITVHKISDLLSCQQTYNIIVIIESDSIKNNMCYNDTICSIVVCGKYISPHVNNVLCCRQIYNKSGYNDSVVFGMRESYVKYKLIIEKIQKYESDMMLDVYHIQKNNKIISEIQMNELPYAILLHGNNLQYINKLQCVSQSSNISILCNYKRIDSNNLLILFKEIKISTIGYEQFLCKIFYKNNNKLKCDKICKEYNIFNSIKKYLKCSIVTKIDNFDGTYIKPYQMYQCFRNVEFIFPKFCEIKKYSIIRQDNLEK